MIRRLVIAFILVLPLLAVPAAHAQDQRCFPETGQCISGRIREFWEQNGGLPVFGFPVTDQHEEAIEGKPYQVQWFERNRLELHPENQRPYDVLLGRLGVDRLAQQGRDWFSFPKGSEQPGCRFFAETGHAVCGAFLAYFRGHGLAFDGGGVSEAESLALFGLPLSEAAEEVSPTDGKTYLTQHFERARMERHPENVGTPYEVLLGLLGNEIRAGAGGVAQPVAQPAPRPLPPASFNNCQAEQHADQAPNYPVAIVAIDKKAEVVTLKNVSDAPVNLDGWRMCSIKGNQEHGPIGGTLQPGEQREFMNRGGNIWNNSERDPGALYNREGQLVSYYGD